MTLHSADGLRPKSICTTNELRMKGTFYLNGSSFVCGCFRVPLTGSHSAFNGKTLGGKKAHMKQMFRKQDVLCQKQINCERMNHVLNELSDLQRFFFSATSKMIIDSACV